MLPTKFSSGSNKTFAQYLQSKAVYVDKTKFACDLAKEHGSFMLHRPHGMGKSLLVSSLKHLFSKGTVGTEGLYCHDHWQDPNCYFVFHFSWTDISAFSRDSFERGLYAQLIPYAELFGVTLDEEYNIWVNFIKLVKESEKKLSKKSFLAKHPELTDGDRPLCNKIVVLVDDYDAPLNKNLQKPEVFKEIKEAVGLFFRSFKNISTRFVLLTGVRGIALCDMFGGANQFIDISLDGRYATSCGYTLEEIERYFEPQIKHAQEVLNIDHETFVSNLHYYIDGAVLSDEQGENRQDIKVFNPVIISSVLNNPKQGFEKPCLEPYLPYNFLVKVLKESAKAVFLETMPKTNIHLFSADEPVYKAVYNSILSMTSVMLLDREYDMFGQGSDKLLEVDVNRLKDKLDSVADIDAAKAILILFQEGYLTFKAVKDEIAFLGLANIKVAQLLSPYFIQNSPLAKIFKKWQEN
ncbi:MAG: AAA family ATPase [Anaerobiospirillum succiniciproducens]|uniref:AAA family ATPase n=1 Tax=Anaerobiospirillum succiniciproducens TaxID=13335 RepID=UPI0026DB6E64|nr:AAA family ATPase [Anaerobiospirillum succiniciproducens]MDO4676805.1 AAA family ATPase [Anaerobiospirillum succiniciproducens]